MLQISRQRDIEPVQTLYSFFLTHQQQPTE
jgi:hypothetical protein